MGEEIKSPKILSDRNASIRAGGRKHKQLFEINEKKIKKPRVWCVS